MRAYQNEGLLDLQAVTCSEIISDDAIELAGAFPQISDSGGIFIAAPSKKLPALCADIYITQRNSLASAQRMVYHCSCHFVGLV